MIRPSRRDFLKFMLASAVAEAVDVEKLLWVPKPIITVPSTPLWVPSKAQLIWLSQEGPVWVDGMTYDSWRNLPAQRVE